MKKNILTIVLFVMFLTIGILAAVIWTGEKTASLGGDFSLMSSSGEWKFSEHAKKWNLIYFGYTHCPDVCPLTLSVAAEAFKKIPEKDLDQIQFIFVSVDSEHDTVESSMQYAQQFFPQFLGFTGPLAMIDFVVRKMGASYILEKNPKSYLGYSISHSDRVFILNSKGIVVDSISNPRTVEDFLQKTKGLL